MNRYRGMGRGSPRTALVTPLTPHSLPYPMNSIVCLRFAAVLGIGVVYRVQIAYKYSPVYLL